VKPPKKLTGEGQTPVNAESSVELTGKVFARPTLPPALLGLEALIGQRACAVAARLKVAAVDGGVLALAFHALRRDAGVGADRHRCRHHPDLAVVVYLATGDAALRDVAEVAGAAHAVVGRVGAAHSAAAVFGARNVVVAFLGAAASGATVGAAVRACRAAIEEARAAVAAGVALAGCGVAVTASRAHGRLDAALAGITQKASATLLGLRSVAALATAALVDGAAHLVVALVGAATFAAGRGRAVRAGATLLVFAAQRHQAAFAVLARADRARIRVCVALRVVAAFSAALAFAAQLGIRIRAEAVVAEVAFTRVDGASAVVVAHGGGFAGQAGTSLARYAAVVRRAILRLAALGVVGHEHALPGEAGVGRAVQAVVAVSVLAALRAVAATTLFSPGALGGSVARAVRVAAVGRADVLVIAVFGAVAGLHGRVTTVAGAAAVCAAATLAARAGGAGRRRVVAGGEGAAATAARPKRG